MSGIAGGRGGYTLAEATAALALAGVLTALLAGILTAVGRLASAHARVSAQADTERAVGAILGAEVRALTAADATFDGDSVRLRAFRGAGVVCAARAGAVTLSYRGVRTPEPDKDSVLLVWAGAERVVPFEPAPARDCEPGQDGAQPIGLAIAGLSDPSGGAPAVALVFETGAYSIANSAFRYRLGAAGRQPLTEENLSDAGSALRRVELGQGAAAVALTLRPAGSARSAVTAWTFHMPQGAREPDEPR